LYIIFIMLARHECKTNDNASINKVHLSMTTMSPSQDRDKML